MGIHAENNIINDKKNSSLISIGIVNFQQNEILFDSIDSILMQNYENIELIICDNCSCDFDLEQIRHHIQCYDAKCLKNVVFYQFQKYVSVAALYQKVYELSTGVFLKIQFANILFYQTESLTKVVQAFDEQDANIICGQMFLCKDSTVFPTQESVISVKEKTPDELFKMIGTRCSEAYICSDTIFWRKSFLQFLGGFPLEYGTAIDRAMCLLVCMKNEKFFFMDQIIIKKINDSEISILNSAEYYFDSAFVLRKLALPKISSERNSFKIRTFCTQVISSLEMHGKFETQWVGTTIGHKLLFKINNLKFYFRSWLVQLYVSDHLGKHMKFMLTLDLIVWVILYFFALLHLVWASSVVWVVLIVLIIPTIAISIASIYTYILKMLKIVKRGKKNEQ